MNPIPVMTRDHTFEGKCMNNGEGKWFNTWSATVQITAGS